MPGHLVVVGRLEPDLEVAGGIEPVEHRDVGDRVARADVELVRRQGTRACQARKRVEAGFLAPRVDERVVEVVDPRAHERGQFRLDRERIDGTRTVGRAHHDVQPRHHLLGHQHREVDVVATERARATHR